MPVVVRYPGRAALLGEHCDWAGGASLAIPLPLGVQVTVEAGTTGIRAHGAPHGALLATRVPCQGLVDRAGGPLRFVGAAAHVLTAQGLRIPPAELRIEADLPAGRGFSSSAAVSLGVLDGLARHAGAMLSPDALAELATTVERDVLGVPCGRLDPLACVAGAPVFLRWTDGRAPLHRVPPGRPVPVVIAALPTHRDTAGILTALHEALAGGRGAVAARITEQVLHRFGVAAQEGATALLRGDLSGLGERMNEAQRDYGELEGTLPELAAPRVRGLCADLLARGALGAKFSGAGGEGSVVGVFDRPADAQAAAERLTTRGLLAWSTLLESP